MIFHMQLIWLFVIFIQTRGVEGNPYIQILMQIFHYLKWFCSSSGRIRKKQHFKWISKPHKTNFLFSERALDAQFKILNYGDMTLFSLWAHFKVSLNWFLIMEEPWGGGGNFGFLIYQKSYQAATFATIRWPICSLIKFGPLFSIWDTL